MELYLRKEVVIKIVLTPQTRRNSRRLVNTRSLETEERWLEERLWSAESME